MLATWGWPEQHVAIGLALVSAFGPLVYHVVKTARSKN